MTGTSDLPAGYTIRSLVRADLPAVLDMVTAASLADEGRTRYTMHELESSFDTVGFDPEHDTRIVLDQDGACAGLAEVYDLDEGHLQPRAYFDMAPSHRSSGIHRPLMAFLDRRLHEVAARAQPGMRVAAIATYHPQGSPILDLLVDAGWKPIRHVWEMAIELDEVRPAVVPTGFMLRGGSGEVDERAVYAASEEAFADHFNFVPSTFEQWRSIVVEYGRSTPDLWLIAATQPEPGSDAEIAGIVCNSLAVGGEPETGYVGFLAVRRPYRRRGLGEALLRSSFALLHEHGMRKGLLHVDSESLTGATRLYERAGMTVQTVSTMHELEITPGATAQS